MNTTHPDTRPRHRGTQPAPMVVIDDVTKTFSARGGEAVQAVDGISLTINPGEVVALLGPNGAGKTTLLDMMLSFTQPTAGRIEVLGGHPSQAVADGRISAVMQTGGLLPGLTVAETLDLVASLFGAAAAVPAVVERAGLTKVLRRRVSKCSGGEQQRLRFALALLPDPDLLILDEPTTGMDVTARRAFWRTIRADAVAGRTILFATHYLQEADDVADRIVLVHSGRVIADGTPEQIRELARTAWSRRSHDLDLPSHLSLEDAFVALTEVEL